MIADRFCKPVMLCVACLVSLSGYAESPLDPVLLPPVETEKRASPPVSPKISTSRPSFTDAAITVPQGSLQAESGATYINNADDTEQWILPETLLRLGLTPNTEFRLTTPNYIHLQNQQSETLLNNFGDISVGLGHHRLLPGNVDLAVFPLLNIPSGANAASGNALDPEVRLVLAKNLTPKLQLSSMVASRWTLSKDALQQAFLTPTCIAYYTFNEHFTGFAEYAAFLPVGDGAAGKARNTHYLQSGLLYTVHNRHQFDVRIATGLNPASPNFLVGFGYSFRLDGLFGKPGSSHGQAQ